MLWPRHRLLPADCLSPRRSSSEGSLGLCPTADADPCRSKPLPTPMESNTALLRHLPHEERRWRPAAEHLFHRSPMQHRRQPSRPTRAHARGKRKAHRYHCTVNEQPLYLACHVVDSCPQRLGTHIQSHLQPQLISNLTYNLTSNPISNLNSSPTSSSTVKKGGENNSIFNLEKLQMDSYTSIKTKHLQYESYGE